MQILKTSKARENILRKIRTGLKEGSLPMPFPEVDKENVQQVFAKPEGDVEEVFAKAFNALGGKFVFCSSKDELVESLQLLYDEKGWKQMLCADDNLLSFLQSKKLYVVEPASMKEEKADACITGCEYLVARTGSVFVSSHQNLGRTSPVYFPVHIIVAYTSQVVPDIQDGITALVKKYGNDLPSMINLNTGPSRTADIEKTLVVGVHGPGEVFCFLIAD